MNAQFTAIIQKLIAERGKDALLDTARGKSLAADYCGTEYRKERRLLAQALEAGAGKAINEAGDLEACKRQQARHLQDEYFLAPETAADVVDMLAFTLRGDASGVQAAPARKQNASPGVSGAQSAPAGGMNNRAGGAAPANFVWVEGGTFSMGSNAADAYDNEKPVHQVTVSSFYMAKYPVTQKEWISVMRNNPSTFRGDDLPVERVTWYEAIEYCNRLSDREGLTPCYGGTADNVICNWNANGYRLPTEAEWEYAAKGGGKDRFVVYEYSGSDDADEVGWYGDNSGGTTHPVGKKLPNSLGIYDMSGNVCEWCWDRYGDYSSESQTDPFGPTSGSTRVFRGGSWRSFAWNFRSTIRRGFDPGNQYDDVGFRLVRR
jgi:formylglycine-generating enzyme required for sulfatase activity